MNHKQIIIFLFLIKAFGLFSACSSANVAFEVETIAQNLGVVWGMTFINEEDILFTERSGNIKILHTRNGKVSSVQGAPTVYAKGQGGLLDIAIHPHFSKNRTIYFSYSKIKGSKQTTAVAKAVLKGQKIVQRKDIFIAQPFLSAVRHFGSRLVFAPSSGQVSPSGAKGPHQWFLYVTVGDRAHRNYAQKLNNHLGKILRLTDQGQAPQDNPFVSVKGALPEIWSYGHRNPQGLFIHPETGQLWGQEHGPRGGDEINLIKKGGNYGWPVITYGKEYWGPAIGEGFVKQGMEQPVKYYTPSIAPSGLLIYSGKQFKNWKNSFFSGALVLRHLNRLEIIHPQRKTLRPRVPRAGREERLLSHLNFRVRHVIEGPKGYIYLSVDAGKILKLKPKKKISGAKNKPKPRNNPPGA